MINNSTGEQHPYYKTAKQIIQYSKKLKDQTNEEWPVIGMCQGFELISMVFAGDEPKVLDTIDIYGRSLPINWAVPNVT